MNLIGHTPLLNDLIDPLLLPIVQSPLGKALVAFAALTFLSEHLIVVILELSAENQALIGLGIFVLSIIRKFHISLWLLPLLLSHETLTRFHLLFVILQVDSHFFETCIERDSAPGIGITSRVLAVRGLSVLFISFLIILVQRCYRVLIVYLL